MFLVFVFAAVRLLTLTRIVRGVSSWTSPNATVSLRVGEVLAQQYNFSAKHPVVFFPGVVSTALELWQGHPCAQSDFRVRYWASTSFVRKIVVEPLCLLEHLTLNATTKSDPNGIRLRAAEGFSAADYWLGEEGVFWLWAPLLRALSDVGYSPKQLHMAGYDWRVSPRVLESRDHFFSATVDRIESLVRINNQRAVLIAHSMGASVIHYLLNFAEHHRGKGWVDHHIEGYDDRTNECLLARF